VPGAAARQGCGRNCSRLHGVTLPGLRTAGLAVAVLLSLAQTAQVDALARARQLYNAQKYPEAVAAASEAREVPALANSASVVFARALLERHRLNPETDDLDRVRAALFAVDPAKLTPRDHIDYLIAHGVAVFREGEDAKVNDRYGAAADFFNAALARAELLDAPARDQLFEWWATALDREAQFGADTDRKSTYLRIVAQADLERAQSEQAASAMFWQVAASRGAGDLGRAWNGALSSWIRAGKLGARGATLRGELDRLMLDVVLPERAQKLALNGDPRPALAALINQWEEFKKAWK
jgi:hypothetical protein